MINFVNSNSSKNNNFSNSLNDVNQSLNGNVLITEGSGASTKYYIQKGADASSKKLLGNMIKVLNASNFLYSSTSPSTGVIDAYATYNLSSLINYKELIFGVNLFYVLPTNVCHAGGAFWELNVSYSYNKTNGMFNVNYNSSRGTYELFIRTGGTFIVIG